MPKKEKTKASAEMRDQKTTKNEKGHASKEMASDNKRKSNK